MIGLGYILLFWLYYFLAKSIVQAIVEKAREQGRNTRIWGSISAFAMFNVLFWDLIPVYGVHSYKCAKEGGFKIYKTIDQWKHENPGIAETLNPDPNISQQAYLKEYKNSRRIFLLPNGTELVASYDDGGEKYRYTSMTRSDGTRAYWLNQRFTEETVVSQVWDIVQKRAEQIIDTQSGEVLAETVEFNTSMKNPFVQPAKQWRDYKIWLGIRSCELYGNKQNWLVNDASYYSLRKKIKYIKFDLILAIGSCL